jgi:AbiV family abortive infection protein
MSETIPVSEVPKGIQKCREKADRFLDTAKQLIAQGKIDEGYILAISGLEEVGRGAMLVEGLSDSQLSGQDFIEISIRHLHSHKAKQQAAMSILPQGLRKLAMGTFNTENVGEHFFAMNEDQIRVLQDLREGVQYVDYREGQWQSSPTISPTGLYKFIEGVEDVSERFLKYSVSYSEKGNRKNKGVKP